MPWTPEDFHRDGFSARNAIELVEAHGGYAKTKMTIQPEHLNALGVVHGGAIFTLAATAFFAACNAAGGVAVGTNLAIAFTKSASSGTLHAEAKELSRGRRMATCNVLVTDDAGELIASLQATAYVKGRQV